MKNKESESYTNFLFDVLKRYDHYIATSNVKAGLLLSFLGVVIFGVVLRLSFVKLDTSCSSIVLVVLSSLLLIANICSCWKLINVVLPNVTSSKNDESLIFFGDVANMKSKSTYTQKLIQTTEAELQTDLAEQVYFVAKVADQKFKVLTEVSKSIKYVVLPLLVLFILSYFVKGLVG